MTLAAPGALHERRLDYAILALLGLAAAVMLFAEPPFIGPDELFHWQRIIQIAQGDWLSPQLGPNSWGGPIDSRAFELLIAFLRKYTGQAPLAWDDALSLARTLAARPPGLVTVPFPSTAAFSPLAYLPQATGVWLANAAGLDLLQQTYAGRLANLVCYLALVALVLHVLPWGRRGVLLFATLPGMLHVAGTLSADPLNLTVPLLLVALVLHLRANPAPARLALAAVALLCLATALLKPTLVAITPIVALVPVAAFRSVPRAWLFRLGCVVAAVSLAALWSAAYPFLPGAYWQTGADPAAMAARFTAEPLDALRVLGRTLHAWGFGWWQDADSRFGGHAAPYYIASGPPRADIVMLAAVSLAAMADGAPKRDRYAAAWLAALGLGYALLVIGAFAIGYTPPGNDVVLGVQGRYFLLPFSLLALAAASTRPPAVPRLATAATLLASLIALGFLVDAIPRLYAMRG